MAETIFVTGGSSFVGRAFVQHAVRAGHRVQVLTHSEASAERVRSWGATPVVGDLLHPGPWQTPAAEARYVVHLAQPGTHGKRVTRRRAHDFSRKRLAMDAHLLDALTPDPGRRIIYVGGTSHYGSQGDQLVDESALPQPKGWGPYNAPAIAALDGYLARGWPIILAFPSWVYGPGSWFVDYTLEPLLKRRPIIKLPGPARTISFVHVEDVGRALLHLLEHGETGQRYFLTDDRPAPRLAIGEIAASVLGVRMRTLSLPMFLVRLAEGPVIADSLLSEARLSNARLKSTGFALQYPTLEQGVPDAIGKHRSLNSPHEGTLVREHRPAPAPVPLPPVCPGLPLLGNAHELLSDPCGLIVDAHRRLGPLFRLRVPGQTRHFIGGRAAKAFMAAGLDELHLDRHAIFDPLEREFGRADFVMAHSGRRHTRLRAPLAISFSRQVASPFIEALTAEVRQEVRRWPAGSRVTVTDQTSRLALAQWRRLLGPEGRRLAHRDCQRLSTYWMMVGATVLPPAIFRVPWYRSSHRRAFTVFWDLVRDARRAGRPTAAPATIVDTLVSACDTTGTPLTDDEAVTYLAYGTLGACAYVARLAAFMLFEIVRDPALKEELRAEVGQAFSAGVREASDLRRMRILQSVYRESLRRHPVSPGMPFMVAQSFDFQGRHFPQGASAVLSPVPSSFAPEAFPDPYRFDAARCREPRNEHLGGQCHPFGLGNRTCVAGGLVEVMAITLVAALLHERDVALDPPGYALGLTVRPLPAPNRRFRLRVGAAHPAAAHAPVPVPPLEEERVAAFVGHDDPTVRTALAGAVVRRFVPGEVIIREGGLSDAYYVLQAGDAVVTSTGSEAPVAQLVVGEGFGEFGLLQNAPRSATVSAGAAGAETLVLDREAFLAMVASSDLVEGEIRSLMQKRIAANRLRSVAPELTASAVATVLPDFTWETYPAGHALLEQGDPATHFFVLVEGEVEVSRRDAGGTDTVVAVLGPGEYFGEVGLLHRAPRNATVTASRGGPVAVLRTDRAGFDRLLNETGSTGAELSRTMLDCAARLVS